MTMKAILIFDNVNDLVFSKWDIGFIQQMNNFTEHGNEVNVSVRHSVAQLLSPIITSQRVMDAQFGNTYSSMQCKDGTNIVFNEWLDHIFMIISKEDVDDMHRELSDTKTIVQHICGQNITLLHSQLYQDWLTALLESRGKGEWVPGASGVIGESGATAAALNCLKVAAKDIKCSHYQHYHLMMFVGDKMLALYSSRGSEDLTPPDIILFSAQCIAAQEYWAYWADPEKQDSGTDEINYHLPWLSQENSAIVYLCAGAEVTPCAPHSVHIAQVAPGITLVISLDLELREIGTTTQVSSQILCNLTKYLLQRNVDSVLAALDALEPSLKRTTDALRKNKANVNISTRLSTRMVELRKSCTTTIPLTPETAASAVHAALDQVLDQLRPDIPSLNTKQPMKHLTEKLAPFMDFLRVKAMRYFSLGSYVEEFPGLIHFIYIDRTTGRYLAPDMADCADMLTPDMIRALLCRGMRVVREGYGAATWRVGGLHACSVLWWERGGVPACPRTLHPAAVRALPPPGDILGSFYRQLSEMSFVREARSVTIKELVCIHLGLLPAATAVQQARRLAHSVHDVAVDARLF